MAIEPYKRELIDFLKTRAIFKTGEFTLKSGRPSPYFLNMGDCNTGADAAALGKAYAATIASLDCKVDTIFGPSYKGVPLAVMTSIALAQNHETNVGFTFDRKEVKTHGDATGADLAKQILVGAQVKDGSRVLLIDDVLTTGGTKNEALELLAKIAKVDVPYCVIAVDRQEVGIDGVSAVESFTRATNVPVKSILTASEIYQHLSETKGASEDDLRRMATYVRVYGTKAAHESLKTERGQQIFDVQRGVIPACDVATLEDLEKIVEATADNPKISAYKIGFELGLAYGLPRVVGTIKDKAPGKKVIYDHQKAGTDIPDTGAAFARVCKQAGVDVVIFFPQAGPETERAWIYRALCQDLGVFVGGRMTHPAYAQSEGGFITDEGALEMYKIAARAGVNHFIVPGNKPDVIKTVREVVEAEGVKPVFGAPGFVAQGGKISDATQVAGDNWHAIVGRGIYAAKDMKAAALEHTSKL
jgi:orotate phosphoribosyltransferase